MSVGVLVGRSRAGLTVDPMELLMAVVMEFLTGTTMVSLKEHPMVMEKDPQMGAVKVAAKAIL